MRYVLSELWKFAEDFFDKMNVSSRLVAARTDPIPRKADQERVRQNYLRVIPASFFLVGVLFFGLLYNLTNQMPLVYLYIYIALFFAFTLTSFGILLHINGVLKRGVPYMQVEKHTTGLFWTACMFSFMACSYFEAADTGTLFHYLIFICSFSACSGFTPACTIPYYIVAFSVQLCYALVTEMPFISILFIFGITVFCILASFIRFSSGMANRLSVIQLAEMAEHDELTGLLNRHGMQKRADILLDYSARVDSPLTVAIIDIDFFKSYNDTFGHAQGDWCLRRIATCIQESYRRPTDVLCRYGGEEFLIMFAGETYDQAVDSLLYLQKKIAEMQIRSGVPDFQPFVTVSVGAVFGTAKLGEDLNSYVRRADENLYCAKANGRNRLYLNQKPYAYTK